MSPKKVTLVYPLIALIPEMHFAQMVAFIVAGNSMRWLENGFSSFITGIKLTRLILWYVTFQARVFQIGEVRRYFERIA